MLSLQRITLIAAVLLLLLGTVAHAQPGATFCGSLSADDCALLTNARAAQIDSASVRFDLEFELHTGDVQTDFRLEARGSGAFAGDISVLTHSPDLYSQSGLRAGQALIRLLRAFDGRVDMTLSLPSQLVRELAPGIAELILELRLINGMTLVNLDPLQPLINDDSLSGWVGINLASLLEETLERDPTVFDAVAAPQGDAARVAELQAQLRDLLLTIGDGARVERGSGSDATAAFVTTLDMARFFDNPRLFEVFSEAIPLQNQLQGGTLTQRETDELLQIALAFARAMELRLVEEIDPASGMIRAVRLEMYLDLLRVNLPDTGFMTGFVLLNFNAAFDDLNAIDIIEMPPTPFLFPYRFLIDSFIEGLQ